MGTLALSNALHAVTKDVELDGFTLPKGTWIMPQMNAMFSDDAFFPAAEQFNPGHHLDEQGRFRRREEFIPFGIGKRLIKKFQKNVAKPGLAKHSKNYLVLSKYNYKLLSSEAFSIPNLTLTL
jgi:hypothetical protein